MKVQTRYNNMYIKCVHAYLEDGGRVFIIDGPVDVDSGLKPRLAHCLEFQAKM